MRFTIGRIGVGIAAAGLVAAMSGCGASVGTRTTPIPAATTPAAVTTAPAPQGSTFPEAALIHARVSAETSCPTMARQAATIRRQLTLSPAARTTRNQVVLKELGIRFRSLHCGAVAATPAPVPTAPATVEAGPPVAVTVPVNPPAAPAAPPTTYTNVDGNQVQRPVSAPARPAGATARCNDGTYSFSQHHSGTCSHHGGVAEFYS